MCGMSANWSKCWTTQMCGCVECGRLRDQLPWCADVWKYACGYMHACRTIAQMYCIDWCMQRCVAQIGACRDVLHTCVAQIGACRDVLHRLVHAEMCCIDVLHRLVHAEMCCIDWCMQICVAQIGAYRYVLYGGLILQRNYTECVFIVYIFESLEQQN